MTTHTKQSGWHVIRQNERGHTVLCRVPNASTAHAYAQQWNKTADPSEHFYASWLCESRS